MTREKLYTREEVNAIIELNDNDLKYMVERLKWEFEFIGKDYDKLIDEIFGDLGGKDEKNI